MFGRTRGLHVARSYYKEQNILQKVQDLHSRLRNVYTLSANVTRLSDSKVFRDELGSTLRVRSNNVIAHLKPLTEVYR